MRCNLRMVYFGQQPKGHSPPPPRLQHRFSVCPRQPSVSVCQLHSAHELPNTHSNVSLGADSPECECRSRHMSRLYSRAVSDILCYCLHNSISRNVLRSCQSHPSVARHSDRRWKRLCGTRKDRGSRAAHGPVGSHVIPDRGSPPNAARATPIGAWRPKASGTQQQRSTKGNPWDTAGTSSCAKQSHEDCLWGDLWSAE